MSRGFDHFDGSGHENFATALVLLCIEQDDGFRTGFVDHIRRLAGVLAPTSLSAWGRESGLATEKGTRRRSDLWFRIGKQLVLVEVKTHDGWAPAHVARQVREQLTATLNGEAIFAVVLLAPRPLLRELPHDIKSLAWDDVLAICDGLRPPSPIVKLAHEHWRHTVERDFGLSITESASSAVQRAATETACLVSFLRAVLKRLGGGAKREGVYFSSPDGQPGTGAGWSWYGVGVPGDTPDFGQVYIGIYSYVDAPKEHQQEKGTKLELYRQGNDDEPVASIVFEPVDLTHSSLLRILEEFITKVGHA